MPIPDPPRTFDPARASIQSLRRALRTPPHRHRRYGFWRSAADLQELERDAPPLFRNARTLIKDYLRRCRMAKAELQSHALKRKKKG